MQRQAVAFLLIFQRLGVRQYEQLQHKILLFELLLVLEEL
mgnify:CR=1 FL=1